MTEREIFLAAIEIEDVDKRAAFLDQACSDDAELRAQVDQLLESHEQTSQFLETPAIASDSFLEVTQLSDDHHEGNAVDNGEEEFRNHLKTTDREGFIGRLGHYEIETILGRGAFGIVAKAFDTKLHRVVAVKMMSPELASTSPPRKRFLREARTAAAVNHENIAAIYAVEEEPIPYLVMEYVAGPTLQQRMNAKGPFEVSEVLEIGRQIASGLAAAHAVNLIHRDIKPSNILLTEGSSERAKISDFGLARAVDDASLTQSGMIAGTPMYMAPEQARGETLDHRADLFSMGSVLYQMVSGRPPFRATNTIAVLKRVCDDEPRPIPDIIREAPLWLCAIISRLMEKDRESRFESAAGVADLFDRCQRELQQYGKVSCVPSRIGNLNAIDRPLEKLTKKRYMKKLVGSLIGGVIAIVVVTGLLLMNRGRPHSDRDTPPLANKTQVDASQDPRTDKTLIFDGEGDYVHIPDLTLPTDEAITIDIKVAILRDQYFRNSPVVYWRSEEQEYYLGPRILSGKGYWRFFITDRFGNHKWWNICEIVKGRIYSIKLQLDQDKIPTFTVDNEQVNPEQHETSPETRSKELIFADGEMATNGLNLGGHFDADGSPLGIFRGALFKVHITRDSGSSQSSGSKSGNTTIALYRFDEGEGNRLTDASGNGHDGIIVGATWGDAKQTLALKLNASLDRHGWSKGAPAPAIAPFDADQAKQHQKEWAKHLGVPVEYENSIGMKLRLIPPGEFMMGSSKEEIVEMLQSEDDRLDNRVLIETPKHNVVISKPFLISSDEITYGQFESFVESTGYQTEAESDGEGGYGLVKGEGWVQSPKFVWKTYYGGQVPSLQDHPVTNVSWNDAVAFCNWMSDKEGIVYRLPTEAEWEYVCRCGTVTTYGFGDDETLIADFAWKGGGETPREVGQKLANAFGCHDMHGNVWEWCADRISDYPEEQVIDPLAVSGERRVIRGGSYLDPSVYLRSARRHHQEAGYRHANIGFRVVSITDTTKEIIEPKKHSTSTSVQINPKEPRHDWPGDAPAPAIAPFNSKEAINHQETWAQYLDVPIEYENSIGMKFRLIPPGEFMMGSTPEEIEKELEFVGQDQEWREMIRSESPQLKVTLTNPLYIGVTEVTQSHYEQVMGNNPSYFSADGDGKDSVAGLDTTHHPVERVSWYEAAEFCSKLSRQEMLKPFYFRSGETVTPLKGNGYRLPTEAEWEFFCGAGTRTRYWSGDEDNDLQLVGWTNVNSGKRTHQVGELRANPFGLFDVHGNLIEWVQDRWDLSFYDRYEESDAINPSNSYIEGSSSVGRDASWYNRPRRARSSYRAFYSPWRREKTIGFRVVLVPASVKKSLDGEQEAATNSTKDIDKESTN